MLCCVLAGAAGARLLFLHRDLGPRGSAEIAVTRKRSGRLASAGLRQVQRRSVPRNGHVDHLLGGDAVLAAGKPFGIAAAHGAVDTMGYLARGAGGVALRIASRIVDAVDDAIAALVERRSVLRRDIAVPIVVVVLVAVRGVGHGLRLLKFGGFLGIGQGDQRAQARGQGEVVYGRTGLDADRVDRVEVFEALDGGRPLDGGQGGGQYADGKRDAHDDGNDLGRARTEEAARARGAEALERKATCVCAGDGVVDTPRAGVLRGSAADTWRKACLRTAPGSGDGAALRTAPFYRAATALGASAAKIRL